MPLPSDGLAVDRTGVNGSADVFRNNACWLFPANGPRAGEALLFLAVQHPGEDSAIHQSGQEELQSSMLRDRDGNPFEQLRRVPLGSNWPGTSSGDVPLP